MLFVTKLSTCIVVIFSSLLKRNVYQNSRVKYSFAPICYKLVTHIILSFSSVQIYDYFIYSYSFLHLRDKYELTIDQLPVGFICSVG